MAYPITVMTMRPFHAANQFTSANVPLDILEEEDDHNLGHLMNEVATKIHIMESYEALARGDYNRNRDNNFE